MGLLKSFIAAGRGYVLGRTWLSCCAAVFLVGCGITGAPTLQELALLDNPPAEVRHKQDTLTPLALDWFKEIEARYLSKGRTLTEEEMEMAHKVGVSQPELVRVIVLKSFPPPSNTTLLTQAKEYGLGSSAESARTMGNIIMIKARFKDERWILAHQLAYIAQQEKMGRRAFVRRFIAERELMGSSRSPMELNANKIALDFK